MEGRNGHFRGREGPHLLTGFGVPKQPTANKIDYILQGTGDGEG